MPAPHPDIDDCAIEGGTFRDKSNGATPPPRVSIVDPVLYWIGAIVLAGVVTYASFTS